MKLIKEVSVTWLAASGLAGKHSAPSSDHSGCQGHKTPHVETWTFANLVFPRVILTACCRFADKGLVVSYSATLWTVACQASLSMGFFQARTLEWVANSFSRGSSQPGYQTLVSCVGLTITSLMIVSKHYLIVNLFESGRGFFVFRKQKLSCNFLLKETMSMFLLRHISCDWFYVQLIIIV